MEPLDKSPKKISRLFDQIAPRYDGINHFLSLGIDTCWRRKTVELIRREFSTQAAPDSGIPGPVLDVCCGTADLSIALFRKLNRAKNGTQSHPPGTPDELPFDNKGDSAAIDKAQASRWVRGRDVVVGIDFSPGMLELGRKKVQKIGAGDAISLWHGDALELPFEDDLFSVVSVGFGLRNVIDTDRGITEMVRVARPGGVVAVLDFDLPRIPGISFLYRIYLQRILPALGRWFSKNREGAYDYFVRSVIRFEKGAAMVEKLQNAGLENVRVQRMTFGIASLYRGRKPER